MTLFVMFCFGMACGFAALGIALVLRDDHNRRRRTPRPLSERMGRPGPWDGLR